MSSLFWWLRAPKRPKPPAPAPTPDPLPTPTSGRLIALSKPEDGDFVNRIYSYWANAWVDGDVATVFAGHSDGTPRYFRVTLSTGQVQGLGLNVGHWGTTEGWYWDPQGRLLLPEGPRLLRIDTLTGEALALVDISGTHPGCRLWQAHSSDDGRVHSATVERITADGPYERLGTVLQVGGEQRFYGAQQPLDESQISRDGSFLLIKEGEDNRIITVATGEERWLRDADGAVGHSDMGAAIVIGEDNIHGACVMWDLPSLHRTDLFKTWNMGHVSVRGGRCLLSNVGTISSVSPTGTVTPLLEHGMQGSDYDHQVRANLDSSGRVAMFLSNRDGYMGVYLLVL